VRAAALLLLVATSAFADTSTPAPTSAPKPPRRGAPPEACTAAYKPVETAIADYCKQHPRGPIAGECKRLLDEPRKTKCRFLVTQWDGDDLIVTEAWSDVWAWAILRRVDGDWKVRRIY
jgi:hypothetical protein